MSASHDPATVAAMSAACATEHPSWDHLRASLDRWAICDQLPAELCRAVLDADLRGAGGSKRLRIVHVLETHGFLAPWAARLYPERTFPRDVPGAIADLAAL